VITTNVSSFGHYREDSVPIKMNCSQSIRDSVLSFTRACHSDASTSWDSHTSDGRKNLPHHHATLSSIQHPHTKTILSLGEFFQLPTIGSKMEHVMSKRCPSLLIRSSSWNVEIKKVDCQAHPPRPLPIAPLPRPLPRPRPSPMLGNLLPTVAAVPPLPNGGGGESCVDPLPIAPRPRPSAGGGKRDAPCEIPGAPLPRAPWPIRGGGISLELGSIVSDTKAGGGISSFLFTVDGAGILV